MTTLTHITDITLEVALTLTLTLRGRRGTARGDIGITFAIAPGDIDAQRGAWAGSGGTFGRCDAAVLLCEAGVALGGIDAHFAWQAWHLVTSTLCGRCGTDSTWLALGAGGRRDTLRGLALGDIDITIAPQV